MKPDDFKAWRQSLDMTQTEAAEALGATKRAIQLWEAGERPISRTVALACAPVKAGLKPIGDA